MGWIGDTKRLPNGLLRALTPRQEAVLRRLALGDEYAAIGERLGISEHRVKQHVAAIAALLQNPRRLPPAKLVLIWAVANGYGDPLSLERLR